MKKTYNNVLALDMGEKRVGVARANVQIGVATPVITLTNDANFISNLKKLIEEGHIDALIVGVPRGQEGQETAQSHLIRNLAKNTLASLGPEIEFQDESLTSVMAEEYLESTGQPYGKGDIDMHAARIILEDWLEQNR